MLLTDLAVAALGGAAVGFERQRSNPDAAAHARFGGLRTFTLIGITAGAAGSVAVQGWVALAAVLAAGVVGVVLAGYVVSSRTDVDATTEIAALVVLAAGILAGAGETIAASAIVALTTLLLAEKRRLHTFTGRIDEATLLASARFAVLALVVLPLLPAGEYGPWGVLRPRILWVFVLFFSGLSFCAWLTRRWLGSTAGVLATGLLGGLISSTSVTLMLARSSRHQRNHHELATATIAACTVMPFRVTAAALMLDPPLAMAFVPYALPMAGIGLAAMWLVWRGVSVDRQALAAPASASPLQFKAALQMAASFQVILVIVAVVVHWFDTTALLATAAGVGLTDMDALTLSMTQRAASLSALDAGRALAVGALSNTVVKLTVAATVGRGFYRAVVVVTLGVMAVATTVSILR